MLILRSFRDYPVAFAGGKGRAFLSNAEAREFTDLVSSSSRDAWLLSRIATKEVVQRYCDLKHSFVPEISQVNLGELHPRRLRVEIEAPESQSVPQLQASVDTSDQFCVTCVRPLEAGERFSVVLSRVESSYPFADFSQLSARESEQVRFSSPEEADRVLHGLYAVKKALAGVSAPETTEVQALSLRGTCDLEGPNTARLHASCWYFDHHVMAIAFQWEAPHGGPIPGSRVEEDPVLPESRHSEITL